MDTCTSELLTRLAFILSLLFSIHLYGTSKENLSKYQDVLSLMIVSFILITWMFEQALIMWGEISFSSLLGLKGGKILVGRGVGSGKGSPRDGLESHPGRSSNAPSRFIRVTGRDEPPCSCNLGVWMQDLINPHIFFPFISFLFSSLFFLFLLFWVRLTYLEPNLCSFFFFFFNRH